MNITRKSIGAVVTIAAIALVTTPQVASAHVTNCKPALAKFVMTLQARGVSCQTATKVETQFGEFADGHTGFFGGHWWLGTIYSRAHHHTYFHFTSPSDKSRGTVDVWYVTKRPVS